MSSDSGHTVFVLGAGFTRAFLPTAPLLVDDYHGESLLRQFEAFPFAAHLIEMEMKHPDHSAELINLERLMTRLVDELPHDYRTGTQQVFKLIVNELLRIFQNRIFRAKGDGLQNEGELRLFAGHCIQTGSTCITFNYDDILDDALWAFNRSYVTSGAWSPDWGYGFPCRMSEASVRDTPAEIAEPEAMLLLKLHGSLNWRIALGYPKPYVIEAVRHHEQWYQHYDDKIDLQRLEPFLELEPMIIPPILTKSELSEQPVLRLIWKRAIEVLEQADRVVFLGYSMPLTDIAASFLFREGLDRLSPDKVSVIDFASTPGEGLNKLDRLFRAYKNIVPHITESRFEFCGAIDWIRDNLTNWLYDSIGNPIAFESLGCFVSCDGSYIGSRARETQVWHDGYRGEIIADDRLLRRVTPPNECASTNAIVPVLPKPGRIPLRKGAISLPDGYCDLNVAQTGNSP